ncbi:MAG: hypothetical protein KJ061_18610 [Vicinamibacteraceae bacterium]|nr:hypothetical protein [Vicinamibacteraceae bacterium]
MWWLIALTLALVALSISPYLRHRLGHARTPDPGWMSVQWLQEYRAGRH